MIDFDPNYVKTPVWARVGQKAIIFNDHSKILFLRRSVKSDRAGGWDFPGGGIEFGEQPHQAILREIKEETRLTVMNITPIHLESFLNKKREFVIMIGYKGYATDTTPYLSWEHDEYQWLSKTEAIKRELPPLHRVFLEKAIN